MKTLTALFTTIIFLTLIGCSTPIYERSAVISAQETAVQPLSCRSDFCTACQQREDDILSSTVRITLQLWRMNADESGYHLDESMGHATLKDGRFLITHNHYNLLDDINDPNASVSVVLYTASGIPIAQMPLTDFNITQVGDETLMFEMKHEYGRNKLAEAGIKSATFGDWQTAQLQPGMEVAQVDWDGTQTHINWATIQEIITKDGVPRLVLDSGVTEGGSGGGVFWNGLHIANNWMTIDHLDGSGNIIYATSVAPMNAANQ